MPTNIILPSATHFTLDLSSKSATKRAMAAALTTSDPGGGSTDIDEVKVYECDTHEDDAEDNSDRLSPVIKEEESSLQQTTSISSMDRLNSEQPFHSFFPYLISPYYHAAHPMSNFDKMPSLESLSKFISPPPAHMANSALRMDQSTGVPNAIYPLSSAASFQSPYSQHWCPPMFPFGLPPGYPLPQTSPSHSSSSTQKCAPHFRRFIDQHSQPSLPKQSSSHETHKSKKSHIKKPLNAFMLFMKEQRAQVVQECTLRESAAINQILGRKWHELDRNVQQKYYDMARDERMRHMQLYPGWSARDNYGARKKRGNKGKKREKNTSESTECLNQKKCRARFGLDHQTNWCKHCKRKKKCLRYTENETSSSLGVASWSDEDDTDNNGDSNDCDVIPMSEQKTASTHAGMSMDSDEENGSRPMNYQQTSSESHSTNNRSEHPAPRRESAFPTPFFHSTHHYPYFDSLLPATSTTNLNEFKQES